MSARAFSPKDKPNAGLRKFHSLALVLLTAFVVLHVLAQAAAAIVEGGAGGTNSLLARASLSPPVVVLEVLLVWLPLVLHVLCTLQQFLRGTPGTAPERSAALILRLTGLLVLLFLVQHLTELRIPVLLGWLAPEDLPQELYATFSGTSSLGAPLTALFYLAGLGATLAHLAYGAYRICVARWPMHDRRRTAWVASLAAGALFLLGAQTVIYYATGSRLLFFG